MYLAKLSGTLIPIPGTENITIHKMHRNVYAMITKTRPKKIGFIGSDGKEYVLKFLTCTFTNFILDIHFY